MFVNYIHYLIVYVFMQTISLTFLKGKYNNFIAAKEIGIQCVSIKTSLGDFIYSTRSLSDDFWMSLLGEIVSSL